MKKYYYKLVVFFILISVSVNVIAQTPCASPPAPSACTGLTAGDGVSITSGTTYIYNTTGTFSSLKLNGGKLVICGGGNLTTDNINFGNGSTLEILSGGQLTINAGGQFSVSNNTTIINRGALIIKRNFAMTNSNNYFYNLGTFDISTNTFSITNTGSFFINFGDVSCGTLNLTAGISGTVCMGDGSTIRAVDVNNAGTNTIAVPVGSACLTYTGIASLSSNLSNTSNLKVCKTLTATVNDPTKFGSAIVTNNCTGGCPSVFPPVYDNCENAALITVDAAAIAGTLLNALPQATFLENDVWYKFNVSCPGSYTITLNNFIGANLNFAVYQVGCPASNVSPTLLTQATGATGVAEVNTFNYNTPGVYYVRVFTASGIATTFNIGVTYNLPPIPAGVILGLTPNCDSTVLSYSAPAANIYWH